MDYRKFGECYYIRMDRNDEIISTILEICKKENIRSATFSGIGGCKDAEIQTFIPETGSFEEQRISGMLELVSLNGNVVTGENNTCYHHTHAVFSYKDGERHCMAAGHMKSITVLYTAEIELHPVTGGTIRRKYDPETCLLYTSGINPSYRYAMGIVITANHLGMVLVNLKYEIVKSERIRLKFVSDMSYRCV